MDLTTLLALLTLAVNCGSIIGYVVIWWIFWKTEKSTIMPQYKAIIHVTSGFDIILLVENAVFGPVYLIHEHTFSIHSTSWILPNEQGSLLLIHWSLLSTKLTILVLKVITLTSLITLTSKGWRVFARFGVITALALIVNGTIASWCWQTVETEIPGIGAINTAQNLLAWIPLVPMIMSMAALPIAFYHLRNAKEKRETAFIMSSLKAQMKVFYQAIIGEVAVAIVFGYLPIIGVYILTSFGLGHEEIGSFYLNYSIGCSTVLEAIPLIYLIWKQKRARIAKVSVIGGRQEEQSRGWFRRVFDYIITRMMPRPHIYFHNER